jgi:hypothetical protein
MFDPKDDWKEAKRHEREAANLKKRSQRRDNCPKLAAHAEWHEIAAQLHDYHDKENRHRKRKP